MIYKITHLCLNGLEPMSLGKTVEIEANDEDQTPFSESAARGGILATNPYAAEYPEAAMLDFIRQHGTQEIWSLAQRRMEGKFAL